MLFSGSTKKTNQRKLRLKTLEESADNNRKMIDGKLKEAQAVDKQLAQVLSDTKELTVTIQQKISSRLKITRNSLKTIVRNVKEGIVILDSGGIVIETNATFEKTFTDGKCILNSDFKEICELMNPTKEDGERFILTLDFKSLSQTVFDTKNFTDPIQREIILEVRPADKSPFKCLFSLTTLDNSPETVEDVTFILFFRCLKRSEDRNRRTSEREDADRRHLISAS